MLSIFIVSPIIYIIKIIHVICCTSTYVQIFIFAISIYIFFTPSHPTMPPLSHLPLHLNPPYPSPADYSPNMAMNTATKTPKSAVLIGYTGAVGKEIVKSLRNAQKVM